MADDSWIDSWMRRCLHWSEMCDADDGDEYVLMPPPKKNWQETVAWLRERVAITKATGGAK